MKSNLLQLLQQKEREFSKGQKRLAKFVSESCEKAAFMTAAKLGSVVGVSESTVIRFALELGFNGYPQLQEAMQTLLVDSTQKIAINRRSPLDENDPLLTLQADAESVMKTESQLDRELFNSVIDTIRKAKHVYILASKTSGLLADFLGNHLKLIFKNVHIVTGSSVEEFLDGTVHVDANDTVLAFDFLAYSGALHRCISRCHSAGAKIVGVTDSSLAPLDQYCDHLLIAKSEEYDGFHSLVAPLSVVNAIIFALSQDEKRQ